MTPQSVREIREAVERVKSLILDIDNISEKGDLEAIKVLLSIAERYLACEGWPEKKPMIDKAYSVNLGSDNYKIGFNEAVKLCRLAHLKDKERLLERASVDEIAIRTIMATANCGYEKAKDYWTGKHYQGTAKETSFRIAAAIHNLLEEGGGK